eukprot:s629_g14.t1
MAGWGIATTELIDSLLFAISHRVIQFVGFAVDRVETQHRHEITVCLAILVSGSLDNASNLLYATFAFYAIILQGGYNCPARDSVTEPEPGLRSLSLALVVAGIVLSIPGSLIPQI